MYLSPLPQNPTGKKKITSITEHLQFPRNLSCLSKFKQRLLLYYANRVTRVTVIFWNVLFTGIPLLVHTELHEWDWKLKLIKTLFWIAVSFETKFTSHIFCPSSSDLVEWIEGLRKGFSFPEKPQKLLGYWQNKVWKCKGRFKWVTVFGQSLDGYGLSFTTLTRLRTTVANFWEILLQRQ